MTRSFQNQIFNVLASISGLLLFFVSLIVATSTPYVWQGWVSAIVGASLFLLGYALDSIEHRSVALYAGIPDVSIDNEPYGDPFGLAEFRQSIGYRVSEPTVTGHSVPLGAFSVRGDGQQIQPNPPYGSYSCYDTRPLHD